MISNRVMKGNEFKDAVYYKVDCDCGSDDCITTIELEYDKDFGDITMSFYKKVAWCAHWGDDNWFRKLWAKIKAASRIMFTGFIELEESFLIRGGDHIDTFIEALNEGKQKFEKNDSI